MYQTQEVRMNRIPESTTLEELKRGYFIDEASGLCSCLFCEAQFSADEVYPQEDGRFLSASGAVKAHIKQAHTSPLAALLNLPKNDTGFTDRQKEVLRALSTGTEDRQTAAELGISASTLRHMRFTFREKSRQAQLCLAICQLALADHGELPVPIHKGATIVDDRYQMTQTENDQVIQNYFEQDEPLRLKQFPAREKKKIAVLRRITCCFVPGQNYSEPQVNDILRTIYSDFALLRRYLIEYGFLQRTKDCRSSWRNEG